ncbi:cell division protein FtsA [Salibacterium salarium]|uniref:cell division protein FtsA n=1 Tax=Salibacterium salarium TaxID=284579 RepID=UPI0027864B6B|nr:cell division protein FtsA [Salibacterium salarium]MDQ0298539.1 cell division protein FtsA [Salibacterium salarium]
MKDNEETLFALDIGTRSVTGLILKRTNDEFELMDVETREHKERSMMDGQIHNIVAVAELLEEIKMTLEERHGKLEKVCVAAAGRSLKTERGAMELDISSQSSVYQQDVTPLELGAVQSAQHKLAFETEEKEDKSFRYHCVGYSVIAYYLDGEEMGSLIDQSGQTASVEVIATFLPKVVVESLISALQRANLVLEALTLEPIAAINVLIPPSMRRLNVALVDIGAGTSDIAITDLSTVTAYGMVPIAGDEVTEALSDQFLLDFPDAERVKRQLASKEDVSITDILGIETMYPPEEVLQPIRPVIQQLAAEISSEIMTLNRKVPKAVMLVGGGSMTPEIGIQLSEALGLPENRVAIRDIDAIKNLSYSDIQPGPELVTPVGIAIAAKEHPVEYMPVTVNGDSLRLFDVKSLTVGDAVLASGLSIPKLYGKPGAAIVVTLNERVVSIPGSRGDAPSIQKNGEPSDLKDTIAAKDNITITEGRHGEPAEATFQDLLDKPPELQITVNDKHIVVPPLYVKNGEPTTQHVELQDRDRLECRLPSSISEIWAAMNWEKPQSNEAIIYLDNKAVSPANLKNECTINGKPANMNHTVKSGDSIRFKQSSTTNITIRELLEQEGIHPDITKHIRFNQEEITMKKNMLDIEKNNTEASLEDSVSHEDYVKTTKNVSGSTFIVQDVFHYVTVDLSGSANKKWDLTQNGMPAAFTDEIKEGDHIELILTDKNQADTEKRSAD